MASFISKLKAFLNAISFFYKMVQALIEILAKMDNENNHTKPNP